MPGSALGSSALFEKELVKKGLALMQGEQRMRALGEEGLHITGLRFRGSCESGGEWLAVVYAEGEGGAVVAFHSESGFVECVVGVMNRLRNGSLKWKEDIYVRGDSWRGDQAGED